MKRRTLLAAPLLLTARAKAETRPAIETRLFGGDFRDGVWQAALDIDIGGDWKTYWRNPGDSGIPPSFDWNGSQNLTSAEVLFPAPQRFHDAAGETLGYKGRVSLPVRVTPADPGVPVDLKLKLFFAVCNDVCVPADAEETLLLAGGDPDGASRIDALMERIPLQRAFIASARLETHEAKPALALAFAPDAPPPADLFVEGTEPAYAHAPLFHGGGAVIPLSGLKDPAKLRGQRLRFTLTSAAADLEQWAVIA